jgi:hypothetical protein
MKKLIIPIVLLLIILSFAHKAPTPYSGIYDYIGSGNLTLELKTNSSFILRDSFGKNSDSFSGSYTVYSNNIKLKFDDTSYGQFFQDLSSGYVEGSKITFKSANNTLVFMKQ